jgi:hypothetical protein
MILPSKHLSQGRALLTIGAAILKHLSNPVTVSALWEQLSSRPTEGEAPPILRYDAFVLALDFLFLIGALEIRDGLLVKEKA